MASDNTDFLRFNAYSFKDLITRKLTAETRYTDQIYAGSNAQILIDLCAYMFQGLTYCLNNAAAESMFSDTQIYSNINRLVKMLGYGPRGITPSTGTIYLDNRHSDTSLGGRFENGTIPRYAAIKTDKTDSLGNKVWFSVTKNWTVNNDADYSVSIVNGKWKLYNTVFTTSGSDYETFVLDGIGSDIDNQKFCGDQLINVWVQSPSGAVQEYAVTRYELYTDMNVDGNYGKIYSSSDAYVNLRLNQDKTYEIKFSNGVIGMKPETNSKVYIFWLDTNGTDGQITPDQVADGTKFEHSRDMFGLDDDMYLKIFGSDANFITSDTYKETWEEEHPDEDWADPTVKLISTTSVPTAEEDVDSIRMNAPEQFKLGQRLVTQKDYEYYIKNMHKGEVIDVKCQNNWEYCATSFYIWLYKIAIQNEKDPSYYINESKLVKYGFKFSDPADANNVYLWCKLQNGPIENQAEGWADGMKDIKSMTHEVAFLEPVVVNFAVCAAPKSTVKEEYLYQDTFDENMGNYIEVTLDNNSIYVASTIQEEVADIIRTYFDPVSLRLGMQVDYNDLMNKLMAINGVQRIRTIYKPSPELDEDGQEVGYTQPTVVDGLSFATWSSSYIDIGDDLDVSNIIRTLEDFQFPYLYSTDISKRIKVVKKSLNNSNRVQY